MDKKSIVVVTLCVLSLFFFQPILNHFWPEEQKKQVNTGVSNQVNQVSSPVHSEQTGAASSLTPGGLGSNKLLDKSDVLLENDQVQVRFTSMGGGIHSVFLKNYREKEDHVVLNGHSHLAILDTEWMGTPFQESYTLTKIAPNQVRATYQAPQGVEWIKTYTLETNFQIEAVLEIRNQGTGTLKDSPVQISLGQISPLNKQDLGRYIGLSYQSGGKGIHDTEAGVQKQINKQGKIYQREQPIEWAALNDQYFTTLITPQIPFAGIQAQSVEVPAPDDFKGKEAPRGLVKTMYSSNLELPPGSSTNFIFTVYTGPKEHGALSALGRGQEKVLNFGIFSSALLWLMTILNQFFHNWGFSIVGVTVILKIIFWPLTAISTRSMKQMQALSPMVNALKEKHKDNPKKMNEEMMKLYRDYKINPLAGCLPMLVQIPIFFGFYTMLSSAIELRGAHFIFWIKDLSMPDTVAWIPGLNFPINPLPLIMAGTQIWQTRITPQAPNADPAMKMMMWFMPAMFLFICYNFSSGLSLYWTVQNLLTIAQTYYTQDKKIDPPQKVKRKKGGFTFSRPVQ